MLYAGAGLSFTDMIFDIVMFREYRRLGQTAFANATIASVSAHIALQVFTVIAQNRKRGAAATATELLFVFTLTKPGVDAHRYVTGYKQKAGSYMNTHVELIYMRVLELFSECLPSALIQAIALVTGSPSRVAFLSLSSSVLTASFLAASVMIEKDADKKSRKKSPDFYGIIPLESLGKTIGVCLLIFFLCTFQLAAKVFACALCYAESSSILAAYLFIDTGSYFVYKMLRGDFQFWFPIDNAPLRIFTSIMCRIFAKTIMDFTGTPHLRHPSHLGGMYYSLIILTTPLICLYFGHRYIAYVEDNENIKATLPYIFSSSQVYWSIGVLVSLQISSFILLLLLIPRRLITTFLSFKTGKQHYTERFINAPDDATKMQIFAIHRSYWKSVAPEVEAFLNEGLVAWSSTKPTWFDAHIKSLIPDDLVKDPAMLLKIRGTNVKAIMERRRSSITGL